MEDIKIYGHLISGISDDNSSYSNGDNWIAEAHDIYDEGFKNLSEEIVEGSLPIERQDQINRYLYNKEVNSTANLTEALSQETTARENNDALLSADISAIDGRLQSQINDIQNKLNNYKLYSIVTTLPTSNIDKNKIYIIASEEGVENNIYTEYIYTENNTWEKLGEFKADIDLTPYVKKTDESNIKAENLPRYIFGHDKVSGDSFYTFQSQNEVELNHRFIDLQTKTMDIHRSIISSATTEHSGVMSSQDKIKLNKCISSDDYVDINKSGILPRCPGTSGQPNTFIPIIDSRFAVPVAEWVILKSVSNKDSIKIKPHNSEDNDYHDILILPSATSTTAGVMSADDKVKLDNINEDSLLPQLPSNFGYYFPISRVNPNSADNSTDWYSFKEPSVYNRDDEGLLNSVNIELSVCKAGSDIPNVLWDISIPVVSSNGAGVMSADDKNKLDSITNNSLLPNTDNVAEGVSVLTVGKTSHAGSTQTSIEWSKLSVGRNGYEMNIRGGNASDNTIITLPPATDNEAGLLPAYLYTPLNNKQAIISNLKLSNDTNITTSDYIVLTKADYQAILDRLTTLEQQVLRSQNP